MELDTDGIDSRGNDGGVKEWQKQSKTYTFESMLAESILKPSEA